MRFGAKALCALDASCGLVCLHLSMYGERQHIVAFPEVKPFLCISTCKEVLLQVEICSSQAMGCASAAMLEEPPMAVLTEARAAKAARGASTLEHDGEEDEKASISTRASTSPSSRVDARGFPTEVVHLESSWDFEKTPIAVPGGMVIRRPPTRRLHERHVRKLKAFLFDVETQPSVLDSMIGKRRLALDKGESSTELERASGDLVEISL